MATSFMPKPKAGSHRTAALMKWLAKSGDGDDTPNPTKTVGSGRGKYTITEGHAPKKLPKGVNPKGTPDINEGASSLDLPHYMPNIKPQGKTSNTTVDPDWERKGRQMSPREAKYYQYLVDHKSDPGGQEHLNAFLSNFHTSEA